MCLGVIGTIHRTWDEGGVPMAEIATESGSRAVCLLYHPDAGEGEAVLAHMGFVVEVLEPDEAEEALRMRRELSDSL
jgi:hydrogenase maturation factor